VDRRQAGGGAGALSGSGDGTTENRIPPQGSRNRYRKQIRFVFTGVASPPHVHAPEAMMLLALFIF